MSDGPCLRSPAFPPSERPDRHLAILHEILEHTIGDSRGRRNPRGVKRKMSNYPIRRRGDRDPVGDILYSAYITIV